MLGVMKSRFQTGPKRALRITVADGAGKALIDSRAPLASLNHSQSMSHEKNETPRSADERLEQEFARATIRVVGWMASGLLLIALGAATVFSFVRLGQPEVPIPLADRLVGIGMLLVFGVLPMVAGCVLVFRAVPAKQGDENTPQT